MPQLLFTASMSSLFLCIMLLVSVPLEAQTSSRLTVHIKGPLGSVNATKNGIHEVAISDLKMTLPPTHTPRYARLQKRITRLHGRGRCVKATGRLLYETGTAPIKLISLRRTKRKKCIGTNNFLTGIVLRNDLNAIQVASHGGTTDARFLVIGQTTITKINGNSGQIVDITNGSCVSMRVNPANFDAIAQTIEVIPDNNCSYLKLKGVVQENTSVELTVNYKVGSRKLAIPDEVLVTDYASSEPKNIFDIFPGDCVEVSSYFGYIRHDQDNLPNTQLVRRISRLSTEDCDYFDVSGILQEFNDPQLQLSNFTLTYSMFTDFFDENYSVRFLPIDLKKGDCLSTKSFPNDAGIDTLKEVLRQDDALCTYNQFKLTLQSITNDQIILTSGLRLAYGSYTSFIDGNGQQGSPTDLRSGDCLILKAFADSNQLAAREVQVVPDSNCS